MTKQNRKMNSELSKLGKKFADFLKEMPEEDLIKLCETQKQIDRWFIARTSNAVVSSCFYARFSGANDPIANWKETKTGKLQHQIVWETVDFYYSLWEIVQLTFDEIHKASIEREIKFPFLSAWDLFLEIVRTKENLVYTRCLEPSYQSMNLKGDIKAYKLTRKEIWSGLGDEEKKELQKIVEDWGYIFWLHIVWKSCEFLGKSNPLIARKFANLRKNIAAMIDWDIKFRSEASKGRIDIKFKSGWWIDGDFLEGQRHGGSYAP